MKIRKETDKQQKIGNQAIKYTDRMTGKGKKVFHMTGFWTYLTYRTKKKVNSSDNSDSFRSMDPESEPGIKRKEKQSFTNNFFPRRKLYFSSLNRIFKV